MAEAAWCAEFERCDVSPSEILAIPLFTVALHRVMVALKYATLASTKHALETTHRVEIIDRSRE